MNIDIITIDLRNFNHPQLKELCDKCGFEFTWMSSFKSEGYAKLFVDKNSLIIIGYTTKKDPTIVFNSIFSEELGKIEPILPEKKKRENIYPHVKELNIDSIMEKILDFGISSLTPDERDFLEKNSDKI